MGDIHARRGSMDDSPDDEPSSAAESSGEC